MTEGPINDRYRRYRDINTPVTRKRPVSAPPRPTLASAPRPQPQHPQQAHPQSHPQHHSQPQPQHSSQQFAPPPKAKKRRFKISKKWIITPLIVLVVVVSIIVGFKFITQRGKSPVPEEIRKSVAFKVYYPDAKKLPDGYILDTTSFVNPVKDGVNYFVRYGEDQKIVFSVQPKPTDEKLQAFRANYLPLFTDYDTPNGKAQIGAYNQKAFISYVTNGDAWVVITAPGDINQEQLKQILSSLKP